MVKGGAAERSGQLHPGDEVLEVNGLRLKGKSVHDICDRLCQMTGTLTFVIVPKEAAKRAKSIESNESSRPEQVVSKYFMKYLDTYRVFKMEWGNFFKEIRFWCQAFSHLVPT